MNRDIESVINDVIWRQRYEGYLLSQRWKCKRLEKLNSVNHTCELCGYNRQTDYRDIPLDVHHLSYEHLGDERLDELQVLCRQCHMKTHGRRF